ncbi:MAG: hypothetical protein K0R57_6561 [Paenibacillaceae bacterium]|jgi:YidC/Oxa1 family membrane protein insertase|nr:hypothetical protein [Paenibacillaceae bacterium]
MQNLYQPVITLLSHILSGIYSIAGDWGIAIIILTLTAKAILYRFNLTAARQMLRNSTVQPLLLELKTKYSSDSNKLAEETLKLYRRYRINPLASLAAGLVQMPVLASMYRLFTSYGSMMSSYLIPWVNHLAEADYLHVLPLAAAGLAFVSAMIPIVNSPAQGSAPVAGSQIPAAGGRIITAIVFALLPLFFTWSSPAALGLYWITGTLFSLLERGFYRTRTGRRLLSKGMPEPHSLEEAGAVASL